MCGDLLDAVKLATEDVIVVKQQHIRRKAFEIQHYWYHEFSKECPPYLIFQPVSLAPVQRERVSKMKIV